LTHHSDFDITRSDLRGLDKFRRRLLAGINPQFRVLYREFLFRMVDLELIAPQGDIGKLLGQFAGLLIFFSSMLALGAMFFNGRAMTAEERMIFIWGMEHFLISTTMLVVGMFAVLSWDSTFLNRRDVLVLGPLPIATRTLFLAKVAALATALGLAVTALHGLAGLAWPALVLFPDNSGVAGIVRTLAAYWFTMSSAGAFIFCTVLAVQGVAAQMPRRYFLRLSAFLQIAAFCLFVSGYFLEPSLSTPAALAAAQNQRTLAWLPSYWFLGMFQELNGSMPPSPAWLARRAWVGLAVAGLGAGVAFVLSYFRTLRKIVEEPDILPAVRRASWLPRFGDSLDTAITRFSIRTLLRSRQHRVILAFYLGLGFAVAVLFLKDPEARRRLVTVSAPARWQLFSFPLMVTSIVMTAFWAVGTRLVFAMPLELRANWVFRIVPLRDAAECLSASRRALYALTVVPICAISAAVFFSVWPWQPAAVHVAVLGLLSAILAELGLHNFLKLPFTCSYLPGKTNIHMMTLFGSLLIFLLILAGANEERQAIEDPVRTAVMLAGLGVVAAAARWRASAEARSEIAETRFDEVPEPAVFALDIHKDGATPLPYE